MHALKQGGLMPKMKRVSTLATTSSLMFISILCLLSAGRASGADPGVTEKEIKIGNIVPYSGPACAYGTIGRGITAYFKKVNDEGGVNGPKINVICYDDSYDPPKAVEQALKLDDR